MSRERGIDPALRLAGDWSVCERKAREVGVSDEWIAVMREVFYFGALSAVDGVLDVSGPLTEALHDCDPDRIVTTIDGMTGGLEKISAAIAEVLTGVSHRLDG